MIIATTPESTIPVVKNSRSTISLPMVIATALPVAAPANSKKAAMIMAARGEREVFLRAFLVVLCLLEGRVYLELDGLEISGNLCRFLSH